MAYTHFSGVDSENGFKVNGTEVFSSDAELTEELADMNAMGGQTIVLQGDSVLDLTDDSTPSKCTIASSGDGSASRGADVVVPVRIMGMITTTVAAGNTAPVITVQDGAGNASGLTLTLTDGDAEDDFVLGPTADGMAMTPIDLTSEDLEVEVTTAAADAGTEAGEMKVFVECLLVK